MNDPELIVSNNNPFMLQHPQSTISYRGPLENDKQNTHHRPMVLPEKAVVQFGDERLSLRSVVGKQVPVVDEKLPTTTRIPSFRRQSSEPISPTPQKEILNLPVSSTTPERRSIFPNFWKSPQQTKSPQRVRSRSLSFSETTPPLMPRPSPLMNRAVSEDCWDRSPALPELPSPLQRLHNHSGVYPLMSPKSILRNKSMLREQRQDDVTSASFNLTRTLRDAIKVMDTNANQSSHSTRSTSSSFDESSNHDGTASQHGAARRQVKFDPRVTVTELAESEPRIWYSDDDLERFKTETVVLAKHYLMQHPEQIAAYSQPVHDPVTGNMRKKALFSMPALSDLSEGELEGAGENESGGVQQRQQQQSSPLLQFKSPRIVPRSNKERLPIQRILVVDRNEKICDLFRRSLSNMFGSDCEIITVQSAAAALQKYRGSDIIIAEERLYKPLKPVQSTSSMTPPPPPPPPLLSPSVSVPANLGNAQHMSGSQLLAKIKADPKQKPCLLIGVSTHPLEDKERFGKIVDLMWGKPPPRMDLRLRNELIARVVAKR